MTEQQHPIAPPPELVKEWRVEAPSAEWLCTQAARWGYEQRGAGIWLPISTAPKEPKPFNMFVVIALEVRVDSTGLPYTSDPWCVWVNKDGSFARWPHSFAPTHWCPLPEYHPRRALEKQCANGAR